VSTFKYNKRPLQRLSNEQTINPAQIGINKKIGGAHYQLLQKKKVSQTSTFKEDYKYNLLYERAAIIE
jgi:hypothetical protein